MQNKVKSNKINVWLILILIANEWLILKINSHFIIDPHNHEPYPTHIIARYDEWMCLLYLN